MKFLVIKFLIIFTLLSCNSLCAYRLQCIESWIDKNYLLDENKVINIDAYVSINNSESFLEGIVQIEVSEIIFLKSSVLKIFSI